MIKKIGLTILFISTMQSSAFATEEICIKTGRQYYIELANYLGHADRLGSYKQKFTELANNLPKKGLQSEFAPSLSSLVQLSDRICVDYANRLFPPPVNGDVFKSGDGRVVTKNIGDDFFGKEVITSERVNGDIEAHFRNYILSVSRIGDVCNYYIRNVIDSGGQPKDQNVDRRQYCRNKSEEILKTLQARNKAELDKMKPKDGAAFKYGKIINNTFKKVLRRFSTSKEMDVFKAMNLESENSAAYAACLSTAASQEFIKNGKCK